MDNIKRFEYSDIFTRLYYEVAVVTFLKKDGSIRIMVCTRNLKTAEMLYGFMGQQLGAHDKRCSIQNGNIAVIDLEIGEARSFSVNRLCDIQYLGEVKDKEMLDKALGKYIEYKEWFNKQLKSVDFDSIDVDDGGTEG